MIDPSFRTRWVGDDVFRNYRNSAACESVFCHNFITNSKGFKALKEKLFECCAIFSRIRCLNLTNTEKFAQNLKSNSFKSVFQYTDLLTAPRSDSIVHSLQIHCLLLRFFRSIYTCSNVYNSRFES